jgi:hypothetical protein
MTPNAFLRLALLLSIGGLAACAPASRSEARTGGAAAAPRPARDTGRVSVVISDTDRDIWPDPEERTGVRIEILRKFLAERFASERVFPATLAEVLPTGPNDPFAGFGVDAWDRPFRYVPAADDYELRSAGPDGRFETPDDIATTRTRHTKMYSPS